MCCQFKVFCLKYFDWLIFGVGVIFFIVLIGVLLVWGLLIMLQQCVLGDGLIICIKVEEWWWCVEYWFEGVIQFVIVVNEVCLFIGSCLELWLIVNFYIYLLWILVFGGKMDMIFGCEMVLILYFEKFGIYCG